MNGAYSAEACAFPTVRTVPIPSGRARRIQSDSPTSRRPEFPATVTRSRRNPFMVSILKRSSTAVLVGLLIGFGGRGRAIRERDPERLDAVQVPYDRARPRSRAYRQKVEQAMMQAAARRDALITRAVPGRPRQPTSDTAPARPMAASSAPGRERGQAQSRNRRRPEADTEREAQGRGVFRPGAGRPVQEPADREPRSLRRRGVPQERPRRTREGPCSSTWRPS